jgi:hypothetical protein
MAQDAVGMKKKVRPNDAQTIENVRLGWAIRRQIQQDILVKRLMQCFLKPEEGETIIRRYPEAMQPLIKDFMQKAEEKAKFPNR